MGERTYITKYDDILSRIEGLKITDIRRELIECNLDDVILTLSDGSELHVTDTLRIVHESFE